MRFSKQYCRQHRLKYRWPDRLWAKPFIRLTLLASIGYLHMHMYFLNRRRLNRIFQIECLDEMIRERKGVADKESLKMHQPPP